MVRQLLYGVVTTVVLAVLGFPLGWLWSAISPPVRVVVVGGVQFPADPEGSAAIGTDGRFAVIALVAGAVCAVVGYALAGRDNDLGLLVGLALGGTAGAAIAWKTFDLPGLHTFEHLVRTAADGTTLTSPRKLRAQGVVMFWPLLAVAGFSVLEALDVARRVVHPRYPSHPPGWIGAGSMLHSQQDGPQGDSPGVQARQYGEGRQAGSPNGSLPARDLPARDLRGQPPGHADQVGGG